MEVHGTWRVHGTWMVHIGREEQGWDLLIGDQYQLWRTKLILTCIRLWCLDCRARDRSTINKEDSKQINKEDSKQIN